MVVPPLSSSSQHRFQGLPFRRFASSVTTGASIPEELREDGVMEVARTEGDKKVYRLTEEGELLLTAVGKENS